MFVKLLLKYVPKRSLIFKNNLLRETHHYLNDSNPPVMKYLNVAEKNDAAKTIAGHLSRGTSRRREGFSTYNKIYEFESNVFGQKSTMIMTSVSGHLLGYEFVGAYKTWQACNPLSLFEAPLVKICPEDYKKIKQTLEREIRGCQGLIIWTDCDREGENIGFEIIQVCTEIKSNLKIYRAKFSEITATSVNRALQTLDAPNKNISDAVDVRQELDLRIGAAFTRFQTLRLQKVFPGQLASSLVSYGSCQFPTLGFVVERYRAVESFIAESFWKIKVSHTMNNLTVDFLWKRVRLFDEQACLVIHDLCQENPTATITGIKSKPKSKWRPLPLDTIEMEKLGSRKLKINAKETMKIAEKLYTQGIISYPRTETNIYPKELDLGALVTLQTADNDWGNFASNIMNTGGPTPRQGSKSDQAHPPIHPTKHVTNLSGNERKVYELIVRSFLACCSKDAQGQETIVDADIAAEKFTANGLMIFARNYLDVYPYDKWSGKEIHIYQEGQSFLPTLMEVVDGQTSAPNLLTEADLIALMEKHGIGTDATHADHIETIKNRSYVALADNIHFVPGLLGMGLVEGYDAMGLSFSKPHLRAGLEADLKLVCEGRKQPDDVLAQQIAKYREVYLTVTEEAQKIDQALGERFNQQPTAPPPSGPIDPGFNKTVMKCPKCKSDMTLKTKKDGQGQFISCMSFPNCKNVIWLPAIVDKVVVTEETCEVCGPSHFILELRWKGRSLEHLYPSPYRCCIGGCDTRLLQTLNINPSAVRSNTVQSNNISSDSGLGNSIRIQSSTSNRSTGNNLSANTNRSTTSTQNSVGNAGTNINSDSFAASDYSSWLTSRHETNTTAAAPRAQNSSTNRGSGNTNSSMTSWITGANDSGYTSRNQFDGRGGGNFRGRGSNRGHSNRSNPHGQGNTCNWNDASTINEDNHVVCLCGDPALLLTVKKPDSPNLGRQFYKCVKSSGGCDFFLWATSEVNNPQGTEVRGNTSSWNTNNNDRSTTNSSWGHNNTNNNSWGNSTTTNNWSDSGNSGWGGSDNTDAPRCNCNLPSKKITVAKEGNNKGRIFYGCPNPANNRCNFFQWADEQTYDGGAPSTSMPSGSGEPYRRGRGGRGGGSKAGSSRGGGNSTSEGRAKKKCGNCREEGHTRNKCPRLQ